MNIRKVLMFSMAGVLTLMASIGTATASSHLLNPFTQAELDTNWEADRAFPTDGVTSVSAFGRDDVARLGIDSDETAAGTFQRTEGIKTTGVDNYGDSVQVDLYIDPNWENKAVRAGFWVVGDDGAGARDNWFGILEFVNLEPSTSGASAQGNHEGWRFWSSATGLWTNLNTPFTYGEWVTLGIELDTTTQLYNYYLNGDFVASAGGGENFIRELFLNSYNYGLDEFPTLSNDSYAAHWHAGLVDPETKDDCKQGGWMDFGFSNQGQCIRFVNTGQDSR